MAASMPRSMSLILLAAVAGCGRGDSDVALPPADYEAADFGAQVATTQAGEQLQRARHEAEEAQKAQMAADATMEKAKREIAEAKRLAQDPARAAADQEVAKAHAEEVQAKQAVTRAKAEEAAVKAELKAEASKEIAKAKAEAKKTIAEARAEEVQDKQAVARAKAEEAAVKAELKAKASREVAKAKAEASREVAMVKRDEKTVEVGKEEAKGEADAVGALALTILVASALLFMGVYFFGKRHDLTAVPKGALSEPLVQEDVEQGNGDEADAKDEALKQLQDLIRELDARKESETAANSQLATLKAELQQTKADMAAAQEKVRLVESTPVARALLANEQNRAKEVANKTVSAMSPTHAKGTRNVTSPGSSVSSPASLSTTASSPVLVDRTSLGRGSYGAGSPGMEVRAGSITKNMVAPEISKDAPKAAKDAFAGPGSPAPVAMGA
uniref:TolA protein n=1 Tax=Alexandrium monilatum TaxID=311494 RepID=A0A6T1LUR5_9DINO